MPAHRVRGCVPRVAEVCGWWRVPVDPDPPRRPDPTRPAQSAQPNPPEFSGAAVDAGSVLLWVCFLYGAGVVWFDESLDDFHQTHLL
ncbi:hypothetical protein UFOVP1158_18 [uncultured Caudovirales phage]|uniref:Uncharacterized protein n=1 Tax=uncultured Caudovirales phage TaxID=2100421 RepID=A0A6J5QSA4_9CAUD|nr:hypothetical protein UFOVP1158_18 [uncultured Caudovirales phage]